MKHLSAPAENRGEFWPPVSMLTTNLARSGSCSASLVATTAALGNEELPGFSAAPATSSNSALVGQSDRALGLVFAANPSSPSDTRVPAWPAATAEHLATLRSLIIPPRKLSCD